MKVTDETFNEKVIEQSKERLVVVDFWADWCGPCNMFGPILEKVTSELGDKVFLAKVNTDENPQKSDEYGISAIPAIKIFRNGELIDQFEGLKSEEALKERLQKFLE